MYPDIQLVIIEGRGCNRFLRQWSAQFDHRRVLEVSDLRDHVACHRNRAFDWFLTKTDRRYLLIMDDDVVPVEETEPVIRSTADIAAAKAWGKHGGELHPHTFSMCCVKIHRRVIEAIQPPWFGFGFSPDGTRQTQCECMYFHDKAKAAGFSFEMPGKIGHRFVVTVLPGDDQPEFVFDGEALRYTRKVAKRLVKPPTNSHLYYVPDSAHQRPSAAARGNG